ncbi:unnamed protein product [Effrenium voratum]|uniref:Anoctamin transmembrane domain-containing protein n=1 Tax=Effrenium voratum TaxID=2562239 RepID=A0AA36JTE0_9DINO|nr:unnamed protein product [Effrenium voratum]
MSSLCGVDAGLKVRGVGLREARRVYHDALRGTSKSEREEAFLEAFRELRPYGRKGDWPGRATTGIPKAESGRIVTEVERDRQLRCLSYGGSFRRVDSGRSPGARSREEDLQPDQLSSAGTSYKHTLDPNLSGSTDLLSLIRNSVVGLLASMGLVVELTFSNDFRYIYALISASEAVLEELAKKHDYPVAADLAQVDPEAAEPCDRCFEPLRPRDPEASELLKELGLEEGAAQRAQGPLEDSQREAFSWYLRSRLKGRSALAALREANAAWPGGKEGLLNTWDRLLGQRGLEVLRVDPDTQGRFLREVEVQRLDGQKVSSHFCREDRTVLIMAAMSDACDIFNLMRDGYVADVLPCTGEREEDIHLAWRRHISSWLLVPALLGILAQVAFVFAEDWQAEVLLGYVLSVSLWCGAALSAWTLKVRRLLLSRGCVTRPCEKPESRRQFHGTLKRSLLTGEMEEQVSSSLGYIARQALSILLCLILAVASVLVAICSVDLLPTRLSELGIPRPYFSQPVIGVLVAAEVLVLNRIFRWVSLPLTRWENHKSRAEFVHAYKFKALSLQFINSYASLFYIAFYPDSLKPFEVSSCDVAWWNQWGNTCEMARLNQQLMAILAIFCLKAGIRCLTFWCVSNKTSQASPERSVGMEIVSGLDKSMAALRFGHPEVDLNGPPDGCFGPAAETVLVLGMLLFFVAVSPWAPLLAFLALAPALAAPSRPALPSVGLDHFASASVRVISWVAMPVLAALVVWPAQGKGRLLALLGIQGDLAAWGGYSALLLFGRLLPGRLAACTPDASRLNLAEARLRLGAQKLRREPVFTARSARARPLGTDFRVRTPQQWEELVAKLTV